MRNKKLRRERRGRKPGTRKESLERERGKEEWRLFQKIREEKEEKEEEI